MNMRLTVFDRIIMWAAIAACSLSASAQSNVVSKDSVSGNESAAAAGVAAPASPGAAITGPGAEVLKLAQSGVSDEVVMAFVKNSTSKYNLSADDILALKDAGLSQNVISAMISHDRGTGGSQQTGSLKGPVVVSNDSAAGTNLGYEQKLYASSASPTPTTQYAPQYSAPTVSSALIADPAPTVSNAPTVDASAAPPAAPPQVEVVPVSPGPGYYWVPGYWAWRGGGWVWVRGTWAVAPRHGAVWVSGHWVPRGHGYVWIGGGWR